MTRTLAASCALVGALHFLTAGAAPAGDEYITVQMGAQQRKCLVHLPAAAQGAKPLPLVIVMHGSGGTGASMAGTTGFDALADKEGFIAAYPDGIVGKNRGWNALFGKPIPGGQGAQVDDVDDVGFIRTLIELLHTKHHTDPARVFVCGHSAGAYMAYRVANDLADRVAAAGVVNGLMGIRVVDGKPSVPNLPPPVAPISVMHICGGKDNLVKFGGVVTPKVVAQSVPACVQHFVQADGCAPAGQETKDAAHGVVRTRYAGGKAGTEVELVLVENCGHSWPTQQNGLPASQELWAFFSKHPKLALEK